MLRCVWWDAFAAPSPYSVCVALRTAGDAESACLQLPPAHPPTLPTHLPLPRTCLQVDGEPWVQAPAAVHVRRRSTQGLVLRRVRSKPLARMMQVKRVCELIVMSTACTYDLRLSVLLFAR